MALGRQEKRSRVMSRLTAGLTTAIAIIAAVALVTLLTMTVGRLVAAGAWWELGLAWSAATWWETRATLKRRDRAGPVLANMGSVLTRAGQYNTYSLVGFTLIVASYFALGTAARHSVPNELALALTAATFGVRCLVVGLDGRAITERGIMGSGEFVRWDQIEGYESL